MTENDIRGHMLVIAGAISTKDEAAAVAASMALATQVLVDLNRIANALEHIAKRG